MAISGGDGSIILTTKVDESGLNDGLKSLRKGVLNFEKALKGVAVAGAGAFVAVGTAAIKAYADFEQLKGGVETLFKDSADVLMRYADKAYQTAGLSANDYMETVTSFSASLLQSLGGDTEKAANYADQAIIDMSDNANKMGTSMEMIQNAYQGFAKQNYTMLDNLKLGYGGTKEEMQRLLDDAEKISGIKYDISSFADVTQAIHVIQTELGITGTTALEASSTIQGSISSMKAAWVNLLVAFANPEQDLSVAIDNLKNSLSAVADNLLPRIGEAFGSIFGSIPTPILAVASAIGAVVAGITAYNAVMKVKNVLDAIQEAESIKLALAQIGLNTAMLASPITWVVAGIMALVAAFVILWNKSEGFRNFWIGLWEAIKTAVAPVVEWIKEAFSTAWDYIKSVWEQVQPYFSAIWEGIKAVFSVVVDVLPGYFKVAWESIKFVWDTVVSYFQMIWDNIKLVFSVVKDVLSGDFSSAWEGIKAIWNNVASWFSGVWDGIKEVFSTIDTWFETIFGDAWTKIKNVFASWGEFFGGLWDTVKQKFTDFGTKMGEAIGDAVKSGINSVLDLIESTINKAINLINGGINLINLIPGVSVGKVEHITLPRLAKGAVIPPNREFLAVLGDQKHGKNIEAPAELIKQMAKEGIAEIIQNANLNSSPQTIILTLDGREVGRTFGKAITDEAKRSSSNFVKSKFVFG